VPAALEAPVEDLSDQSCCGHWADAGQLDQSTGLLSLRERGDLLGEGDLPLSIKSPYVLQDEMKALELAGDLGAQIPSKLSPIACSELSQDLAPVATPQSFDLSDAMKS
jgi:hypothetical protein